MEEVKALSCGTVIWSHEKTGHSGRDLTLNNLRKNRIWVLRIWSLMQLQKEWPINVWHVGKCMESLVTRKCKISQKNYLISFKINQIGLHGTKIHQVLYIWGEFGNARFKVLDLSLVPYWRSMVKVLMTKDWEHLWLKQRH